MLLTYLLKPHFSLKSPKELVDKAMACIVDRVLEGSVECE
jgi:hypothetical protein